MGPARGWCGVRHPRGAGDEPRANRAKRIRRVGPGHKRLPKKRRSSWTSGGTFRGNAGRLIDSAARTVLY